VWSVLEPATRTFLASAEAVFRARRSDPAFDFSGPAIEYGKAVESELNALLLTGIRKSLSGKPQSERQVLLDGGTLDLGIRIPPQPLGTLLVMLEKKPVVQKAVRMAFPHDHAWLLGELPHCLRRITGIRNPAAHTRATTRDGVGEGRDEVLGIGCEGLVVGLARVRMRAR
jgi:hypothetical protein